MCFGAEAVWIPAAIAAAGAGATAVGQHQATARADRAAAAGVRSQDMLNRRASQRVNQETQKLAKSDSSGERATANADFLNALRKARGADAPGAPMGGASDRFSQLDAGSRAAGDVESANTAGLLADIDAPTYQRQREGTSVGNAAVDLSLLGDRSRSADFLTQLRTERAGRVNPWLQAGGQFLSAYGQAAAAKTPGVKKPSLFNQLPDQTPAYGVLS